MVTKFMENIVKKLIAFRLAKKDQIKGCTQEEIRKLETYHKITLPKSYKDYLLTMGVYAGVFDGDLSIYYKDLFNLKKRALEMLRYDNSEVILQDDAFIFNTFDGEGFSYFQTDINNEDPPVYVYYTGEINPTVESFSKWLLEYIESLKYWIK